MTQKDYRHVCFKDLENYFKKDEYFGDLSDLEKQQIRENLGIQGSPDIKGQVVKGSYDFIKGLVDTNVLTLGSLYIIDDFQTIYECNGEVLGTSDSLCPSTVGFVAVAIPLMKQSNVFFLSMSLFGSSMVKVL